MRTLSKQFMENNYNFDTLLEDFMKSDDIKSEKRLFTAILSSPDNYKKFLSLLNDKNATFEMIFNNTLSKLLKFNCKYELTE